MRTALAALCLLAAPLLAGDPLVVNSTDDLPDADLLDGVCDADLLAEGLQCTLRAAVMHVNATPGADTITLPAGLYKLKLKGSGEDAAATGDLDVTEDLQLDGDGASLTIIDAGKAKDRVFDVHPGASLALAGVTLRKGRAADPEPEGVASPISGGGGVRVDQGGLSLDACVVSRCRSLDDGGGVEAGLSVLVIADSTVDRCRTSDDGGGLDADECQTTISGSTFSRNKAKDEGGAIEASGGQLALENCTLSGNRAKEEGGALSVEDAAQTSLSYCTVAKNRAKLGSGISESDEFGGDNLTSAVNSIFANAKQTNCDGTIDGSGNIETGTSCDFDETNLSGTDPRLVKLAENGGPTRTHALRDDSPAVDTALDDEGDGGTCLVFDQRGVPRVQVGFGPNTCDVGAFEFVLEE